jgi:hypothetical protein
MDALAEIEAQVRALLAVAYTGPDGHQQHAQIMRALTTAYVNCRRAIGARNGKVVNAFPIDSDDDGVALLLRFNTPKAEERKTTWVAAEVWPVAGDAGATQLFSELMWSTRIIGGTAPHSDKRIADWYVIEPTGYWTKRRGLTGWVRQVIAAHVKRTEARNSDAPHGHRWKLDLHTR